MLNILFSPKWFYGKDILIDIVSIIVLGLISYVTFRYYHINKHKKQHLWFSIASLLLSLSFLFKILTNFTLYQQVLRTQQLGLFTFTYQTVQYSDTLFLVGTLLYRLLTLLGLYVLFSIYYNDQPKPMYLLTVFFIFVSTYFTSANYYIFHITALLLLMFVVKKFHDNSIKTKDKLAKLICGSFAVIMLSQLVFVFVHLAGILYVIAEIIQLIGYGLLLASFILVRHYGKKK